MGLAKVGSKLELSNPQFHINVTAIFSHPTAPHYIVQVLFLGSALRTIWWGFEPM